MKKLWYSFMYRWCMANAYLIQDVDPVAAANWLEQASGWQRDYTMAGRSLR